MQFAHQWPGKYATGKTVKLECSEISTFQNRKIKKTQQKYNTRLQSSDRRYKTSSSMTYTDY